MVVPYLTRIVFLSQLRCLDSFKLFPPGVSLLTEDSSERLSALKEITGLTWEGMAPSLGVEPRQLHYWRNGGWPNGGAMLSLVDLATRVPGA